MYDRSEIDALETKKSSLTCGCIHWHASLQMANQVQAGTKAPFPSKVYCEVTSKVVPDDWLKTWKRRNRMETCHEISILHYSPLIFSLKSFFGHCWSVNSEKTITDLELGLWYILEGLLRAKALLQNMNLPQITSPNLQADLATHEKSSILNPCAVDVVGHPRVENWWSRWVFKRCLVQILKHIDTLKYSGCFYLLNTLTLVVSNDIYNET